MPRRIAGLYAIADTRYLNPDKLLSAAGDAIRGGATALQYRDKGTDAVRRREEASALAKLCRTTNTLFIVNDDIALARDIGADGVHLGRNDVTLSEARRQLGVQALIGISCYNELARALSAQAQHADYVAFGRFFPSRTKPDAANADPGLLNEARVRIHLPIVAIGGVTPENGSELISHGADALAVIEGIFGQTDCYAAAKKYARLFSQAGQF